MECELLLERLGSTTSSEQDSREALDSFVQANQANFNIAGSEQCKESLCRVLLEQCDQSDPPKWSHDTVAVSLSVLRILARQMSGCGPIVSDEGLGTLSSLAGLSGRSTVRDVVNPELTVMVEAVKCLCNIVLKNHALAPVCERIGVLKGLTHHLTSLHSSSTHYELMYYDLRLLFLITACGPEQRISFRDDYNGIITLVQLMDSLLFPGSASLPPGASCSMRDSVALLPCRLDDRVNNMVCEVLKILFNQTVQLAEEVEEVILQSLVYMIRVLLTSVPAQLGNASMTIVSHCAEVLINMPPSTASCLLLSESSLTTPTLSQWYPGVYDTGAIYTNNIDTVFDGYNMAAIVNLLNYLHMLLCDKKSRNLNAVLAALRQASKGHRSIRRYLKSQILPPLGVVTHRPEEGDTLKSRLVRLMLPGNHGAEEVAAELLFVLCKEDGTRLTKHTGYGNAAGLLMAHGLLGGGRSEGAELYSSDSEDSDTDEYLRTRESIDPVTGGPAPGGDGRSPLDDMTEEEKEREAEQLHHLIEKMNAQGIIKMVSVKDQPPVVVDNSSSSEDDD